MVKVRIFVYDKVFAHQQFLKQQLYLFKRVESKTVIENLAEFNIILDDLENIVSEGYEDEGVLVVCCLEDEEGDVSHFGSDA